MVTAFTLTFKALIKTIIGLLHLIPHPVVPLILDPSDGWFPVVFIEGINCLCTNWVGDQVQGDHKMTSQNCLGAVITSD